MLLFFIPLDVNPQILPSLKSLACTAKLTHVWSAHTYNPFDCVLLCCHWFLHTCPTMWGSVSDVFPVAACVVCAHARIFSSLEVIWISRIAGDDQELTLMWYSEGRKRPWLLNCGPFALWRTVETFGKCSSNELCVYQISGLFFLCEFDGNQPKWNL